MEAWNNQLCFGDHRGILRRLAARRFAWLETEASD